VPTFSAETSAQAKIPFESRGSLGPGTERCVGCYVFEHDSQLRTLEGSQAYEVKRAQTFQVHTLIHPVSELVTWCSYFAFRFFFCLLF